MNNYAKFVKPVFDKLVALSVLLLFAPVWVIISILVTLDFKESPFFKQLRIGFHCKPIRIFKFKKMREIYKDGKLLPEEQRMTRLGKFIRRSSIDEIPQFFNILTGQMSIIGPRPLLARYLPYYTPLERLRHLAKPGLTGWAQVNGRYATEWTRRFEYDLYYVENLSLWLDLKILFLTVKAVFQQFIHPVNDPVKILPRFDHYRHFIRLPNDSDNKNMLLNLIIQQTNNQLDTTLIKSIVYQDYFSQKNFEYFLLLSENQGKINSFSIFKNTQGKTEQIFFFSSPEQNADSSNLKAKYLELGQLYAKHFKILAAKKFPTC